MVETIALVFFVFIVVYIAFRLFWYYKVALMLETLAEARGFKGDTKVFRDAIVLTGALGAMTVLAMPDKNIQRELKELRNEVKTLREELASK